MSQRDEALDIICPCGLKLRPKYRGDVKPGQKVRIVCRCGSRHEYTATAGDQVLATLHGLGRMVDAMTKKGAA